MPVPSIKKDNLGAFELYKDNEALENPKISVILSAHNAEKTIKSSVISILNQTFSDIELIVTDDGSHDATFNILRVIQADDPRLVIIKQQNMGLTKSLNRMILLSKGHYIARQDADDTSILNRLDIQFTALQDENYNFCVGRYMINSVVQPRTIFCRSFSTSLLYFGNILCHGTFFGTRSIFLSMYDQDCSYAQDVEFLLRNRKFLKIRFIESVIYNYEISENQISKKKKYEQFENFSNACKKSFGLRPIKNEFLRKFFRFIVYYIKFTYENLFLTK